MSGVAPRPAAAVDAAGPSSVLLAYRVLAFCYTLAVGVFQLRKDGSAALLHFQVWNWWLLATYFGLAARASVHAAVWPPRGAACKLSPLDKAALLLYHVEGPVG